MLNFISLGGNLYFERAISEIISEINSSFGSENKFCDANNSFCHMKTRHIVTINDHSPLQSLIGFSKRQEVEEGDEIVFLSNFCTKQLAQNFIKRGCCYIIEGKKITIKRLMQLCLNEIMYCHIPQDKIENLIFTPIEMKILEGIHGQFSVRQISKKTAIPEKSISRHKIKIMKKMGLSSYHQLLSLVCNKTPPHDFDCFYNARVTL